MEQEKSNKRNQIADEICLDNLKATLCAFNTLNRYTGSDDGEKAVDYISEYCSKYGMPCDMETYSCFRSLPIFAEVIVPQKDLQIPALAAVFSGEADKLSGEVYYDVDSEHESEFELDNKKRFEAFAGKIVLSNNRSGEFALKAAKAKALGVVNIWPNSEELLHHNTIGTVWGNPTLEDNHRHCYIPFLGVTRSQGLILKKLCSKGTLNVTLNIKMDLRVIPSRMPVIDIPGKSSKFVLVSGHYDSWYEGITDNATANAATLECARVIWNHRSELKRGVRFAFWSGHSDGRYAGSSWYVDHHWEELNSNCVAHINLDLLGGKNDQLVSRGTNLMEKEGLSEDIISEFSGVRPVLSRSIGRSGDESFSGVGVPISMLSRFFSYPNGEYAEWANIFAPWWHSVADTIDKVDYDYLVRDAKINLKIVWTVSQAANVPVDTHRFLKYMDRLLHGMSDKYSSDFDLSLVFPRIAKLDEALNRLDAAITEYGITDTDDIIIRVSGEMVRLTYTYGSPYYHDPAYGGSSEFHILKLMQGVTPENTSPETYLMLQTDFTRQRTRLCVGLANLVELIDDQIFHWSHAQ